MPDIVLVEDSSSESGLACIAIALRRPDTRVHEARDLQEALALLEGHARPRLAILGWRALKEAPARLARTEVPLVGLAANLTDSDRQRALDAGVRVIYDRPNDWRPYCDALEALLDEWLDARRVIIGIGDVQAKCPGCGGTDFDSEPRSELQTQSELTCSGAMKQANESLARLRGRKDE